MTNIQHIESTMAKSPWVLPHGWKWYKWGDLVISYEQGLIRSNTELVENGTFYFKMHNIDEDGFCNYGKKEYTLATKHELMKYALNDGDFLINVRNSYELVGKTCVVSDIPNSAIYNHMIVKITHVDERLNYFLNALFSKTLWKKYIDGCKKGTTTVIALYKDDLLNIPIPIPPESIFSKICSFEKTLLKKRTVNLRICAELEFMAKTLYDYWFTQFDFPNADGKPYRTSGGEMVWNDQLKREIPKGWYSSVIANHIGTSKGGDWGKEEPEGNYQKEVVCIRGADFPSINASKPLNAPVRYILSKNADKILSSGDIIVEISGGSPTQSTGRICYINDYTLKRFNKEIITSNFCKAFSTKKASEQYWLYLLWKTLYDAGVLFGFEGKTTGIKNLLFDDFCAQYCIVAPDETILQKFHEVVSPIFNKIQQCNIENDELTRLRDWLLPMLMNGQATVE